MERVSSLAKEINKELLFEKEKMNHIQMDINRLESYLKLLEELEYHLDESYDKWNTINQSLEENKDESYLAFPFIEKSMECKEDIELKTNSIKYLIISKKMKLKEVEINIKKSQQEILSSIDMIFFPICEICYQDEVNTSLHPCGHLFCDKCVLKISKCAKCRTDISLITKLFK
jgi:hypothetical protein